MNSWAILFLVSLVLIVFVIVFALCRKDSVRAVFWFRPFGFFLEAKNNATPKTKG
jgi:hypothetical protein